MPFRALTDDELREAAQETMLHGDWFTMRDVVVTLFPDAKDFGYYFVSEYNDEGYDMRMHLDFVTNQDGALLVSDRNLTKLGCDLIIHAPGWPEYEEENKRWGGDPENFFYETISEMDDSTAKLWLEDGDETEVIVANIKTGPVRKFPVLFVAVSE